MPAIRASVVIGEMCLDTLSEFRQPLLCAFDSVFQLLIERPQLVLRPFVGVTRPFVRGNQFAGGFGRPLNPLRNFEHAICPEFQIAEVGPQPVACVWLQVRKSFCQFVLHFFRMKRQAFGMQRAERLAEPKLHKQNREKPGGVFESSKVAFKPIFLAFQQIDGAAFPLRSDLTADVEPGDKCGEAGNAGADQRLIAMDERLRDREARAIGQPQKQGQHRRGGDHNAGVPSLVRYAHDPASQPAQGLMRA